MELGWSVLGEVHAAELFLRDLAEDRWGLKEAEGDAAIMATEETTEPEGVAGSDPVLPAEGDPTPVSVGGEASLMQQMAELYELLVEFAGKTPSGDVGEAANKALLRAAGRIKVFNDAYPPA